MHFVLQNHQIAANGSQQRTPGRVRQDHQEPPAALRPGELQLIPNTCPYLHWPTVRPHFFSHVCGESGLQRTDLDLNPAGGHTWEEPWSGLPVRQQLLKQSRDGNQGCRLQVFKPQQLVNHSTVFFMLFWQESTCDFGATVAGVFSQQRFNFCQDLTIRTAECVFIALYKVAGLQQSFNISDF